MQKITMQQLLEAGVHFGHQTRRWNPKMKPFIHTARGGIHIIDLEKTAHALNRALSFVQHEVRNGKTVLFVSTKQQTKDLVPKLADACGMPYVTERWLGGFLTNFKSISKRIKRLRELDEEKQIGTWEKKYTKKEALLLSREMLNMNKVLYGVRNMTKTPDIVFVVDVTRDSIAVREAKRSGIPTIALIDTNADPYIVDYPIPSNDDGMRSLELMLTLMSDVIRENTPVVKPVVEKAKDAGAPQKKGEATESDMAEKGDVPKDEGAARKAPRRTTVKKTPKARKTEKES